MDVYTTLSDIQRRLSVPKNQYNSFGKYNYRSCEDILEAVKPLLGKAVLTVSDEMVEDAYKLLLDKKVKRRVVRLSKSAKSYNMEDALSNVTCPTLLIWGKNDIITPKDVAQTFEKRIKKSKLVLLDKCCHAPMMEHPQAFARISLDFLLNHKDESFFS